MVDHHGPIEVSCLRKPDGFAATVEELNIQFPLKGYTQHEESSAKGEDS
jgi:hypothetical protein